MRDDCIATVQSRRANDLRSMDKEPGGGGGDNCYAIPWTPDSPCLETCASVFPPQGPENEARMQQQGGASGMRPSDCLTGYDSISGEKEIRSAKLYSSEDIKLLLKQDISILTLNIGGLRLLYKKKPLKEMARQLQFDIGIITETHMLEEEMQAFQLPGYELIHKVGSNKQLGGVMIIATPQVSCGKLENAPLPKSPIDA